MKNNHPDPIEKAWLLTTPFLVLPPVSTLRLTWRFLFFIAYTTLIVAEIRIRYLLFRFDIRAGMKVRRRWARNLIRGAGVRGENFGAAPDFPCIVVSNHRSYLDPILMLRDIDGFPVAKAELENWPVIGKGAKLAGILYLRREHSGSRINTLRQIEEKVKEGFPVIIFPEGTTSGLPGTLPFKKGVFQLAARTGIPVVPVALAFRDQQDFWVGKEGFMRHAGRRFREKRIFADVHYGPALRNEDADILLAEARNWIEIRLLQP